MTRLNKLLIFFWFLTGIGLVYGWVYRTEIPSKSQRLQLPAKLGPLQVAADRHDVAAIEAQTKKLENETDLKGLVSTVRQILGKTKKTETDWMQIHIVCNEKIVAACAEPKAFIVSDQHTELFAKGLSLTGLILVSLWMLAVWEESVSQTKFDTKIEEQDAQIKALEGSGVILENKIRKADREYERLKVVYEAVSISDYDPEIPGALNSRAGLERVATTVCANPAHVWCFAFDFDSFRQIVAAIGLPSVQEIMAETGDRIFNHLGPADYLIHKAKSDEIQIFFCGLEAEDCYQKVRAIYSAIGREQFETSHGQVTVTLSGGVAELASIEGYGTLLDVVGRYHNGKTFNQYSEEDKKIVYAQLTALKSRADGYAYLAKEKGKNQVIGNQGRITS